MADGPEAAPPVCFFVDEAGFVRYN